MARWLNGQLQDMKAKLEQSRWIYIEPFEIWTLAVMDQYGQLNYRIRRGILQSVMPFKLMVLKDFTHKDFFNLIDV